MNKIISPFPYGTCSLSVSKEISGREWYPLIKYNFKYISFFFKLKILQD